MIKFGAVVSKASDDLGKHKKDVKGKKAVLSKDISFFSGFNRTEKNKHRFKVGTQVEAIYSIAGTKITMFKFTKNKLTYEYPLKEGSFEWMS